MWPIYIVNIMPADALTTLGASALAGIVLTSKAGLFRFPASEEF